LPANRRAVQVAEHLPALLVEPEHSRCTSEAAGLEVTEDGVHRRGPRSRGAVHGVGDPHRADSPTAGQHLLIHPPRLGSRVPDVDRISRRLHRWCSNASEFPVEGARPFSQSFVSNFTIRAHGFVLD
jgi:hypothetical protein